MTGVCALPHPWGPWAGGGTERFEQSDVRAIGKLRRWGDARIHYLVRLSDGAELFVNASKQDAADEKWLRKIASEVDAPSPTRDCGWSIAWSSMTETIVVAAIRIGGVVYAVPRPGRHHDVLKVMPEREAADSRLEDQGFVTSTGRFVNRAEAADLARAANQLIRVPTPRDTLTSEDVW